MSIRCWVHASSPWSLVLSKMYMSMFSSRQVICTAHWRPCGTDQMFCKGLRCFSAVYTSTDDHKSTCRYWLWGLQILASRQIHKYRLIIGKCQMVLNAMEKSDGQIILDQVDLEGGNVQVWIRIRNQEKSPQWKESPKVSMSCSSTSAFIRPQRESQKHWKVVVSIRRTSLHPAGMLSD